MQLFYQSQGHGQPLVLLHGLLGSGDNWTRMAEGWAQSYQVVQVDLRNHGRSPHAPTHSYTDMAEDLATLFDDLGLNKVHLLGHSMGGKAAMTFASLYPERIDKLIVVDMAMREYPPTYLPVIDAMRALDLSQLQSRADASAALSHAIPDTQLRQFLLTNLMRPDAQFVWRTNLAALSSQYAHIQAAVCQTTQYTQPTLFIRGEHSDYIQAQDVIELSQHFTRANFVSLPTGHWVHAEQPALFIKTVDAFLTQTE